MGTKLCYNCFEKIDEAAEKCEFCEVEITDEIKIASKLGGNIVSTKVETDYNKELERLKTINKTYAGDAGYYARLRKKDLYRLSIITSILGLMQIYTAGLIDSINEVAVLLDQKKVIDGYPLLISGFLYFIGILGLFKKYNIMRKIFLVTDLIHLIILYQVYKALSVFILIIEFFDISDFPIQLKDFLEDIVLLKNLIIGFAIFYIVQIFYMYRKELQSLRCR